MEPNTIKQTDSEHVGEREFYVLYLHNTVYVTWDVSYINDLLAQGYTLFGCTCSEEEAYEMLWSTPPALRWQRKARD
jgi:hypothetical protein